MNGDGSFHNLRTIPVNYYNIQGDGLRMSTQDEYLRNFTVLLSEKGVVPLKDPMQIAVYNELRNGGMRPSDIATSLDIPTSSLHFVLDKMTDSGVIIRYKPDPNKKSVYYANFAQKIAGAETPAENAAEECEKAFKNPSRYYSGLSSVAYMLDSYFAEIGLSLDQIRNNYASELAESIKIDIGRGSLEDSILKIKERFAAITGFKFSVFALNPLTLVFEGDTILNSQLDMLSAFVKRAVENATGKKYAVSTIEDFGNEEKARVKIIYDKVENSFEPYINMSLPNGDTSKFIIVETDGSVGLIINPTQLDIVDAIYERPLCVTDVIDKINAPRSTVTSNLLKMVEEGIVSVFYSEPGVAYYGMSCSILAKKSRGINRDSSEIREILNGIRKKENAFLEGYLLYLLASLRQLGFDTEYMMVVLGAKFMRIAGNDGPRNFDVFFGKMSEVANTIGLSLNVVSVYPLTIGISCENSEYMSPAMTFVKGMAHQGLEMASNGIFVRVSEDTPEDRKVSFKEIYPALSVTPHKGAMVEGLAEDVAASAKKKRTSSLKVALSNRSQKEGNKPARTTRYITGVVMVALMAAVLLFAFGNPGGDYAEAENYSLTVADGCPGVTFYDENGMDIGMPMTVKSGCVIGFTYESQSAELGIIKDGVAYPVSSYLETDDDGIYRITVSEDLEFKSIVEMDMPAEEGLSYQIYSFGSSVSDSYADSFEGYMTLDEYAETAGGLWVSAGTVFKVTADEGSYVDVDGSDIFYFDSVICGYQELDGIGSEKLPGKYVEIHLEGNYEADGIFVNDMIRVAEDSRVSLKFISTNGHVEITMVDLSGTETNLGISKIDRTVTFDVGSEDLVIKYRNVGIY